MEVQILGPSCADCLILELLVLPSPSEFGIRGARVEKITTPHKMARLMSGEPRGLGVNGRLVPPLRKRASGSSPHIESGDQSCVWKSTTWMSFRRRVSLAPSAEASKPRSTTISTTFCPISTQRSRARSTTTPPTR
jgi:hypothetical protein